MTEKEKCEALLADLAQWLHEQCERREVRSHDIAILISVVDTEEVLLIATAECSGAGLDDMANAMRARADNLLDLEHTFYTTNTTETN